MVSLYSLVTLVFLSIYVTPPMWASPTKRQVIYFSEELRMIGNVGARFGGVIYMLSRIGDMQIPLRASPTKLRARPLTNLSKRGLGRRKTSHYTVIICKYFSDMRSAYLTIIDALNLVVSIFPMRPMPHILYM